MQMSELEIGDYGLYFGAAEKYILISEKKI